MANARAAKKAAKAAEAKAAQVKPEVKAEEVKAETKAAEVAAEVKTEEVKTETKAAETKTEVKAEPAKETKAEVKTEPVKKVGRPRKNPDAAAKAEKKPAAKTVKAAAKTTKTAKAAKADKEEAAGVNVVVEFNGTQRKVDEIVAKIKDEWVAAGHRVSTIKSLDVYIKPQDYTAYYVINGKIEGKVWM